MLPFVVLGEGSVEALPRNLLFTMAAFFASSSSLFSDWWEPTQFSLGGCLTDDWEVGACAHAQQVPPAWKAVVWAVAQLGCPT